MGACVVATPGCHERVTSRSITSGPEVDEPSREAEWQVMVREQLEGRGIDVQELVLVTKMPEGPREERLAPVQFAPMMRST